MKIYNTLSHSLEEFRPLEEGRVSMYNCGPTVWSAPHIGNFRSFIMADLLRRYFDTQGVEVTQVMNITDVGHLTEDDLADAQGEDKLERQAREQGLEPLQIARHYEGIFFQNLKALGLREAHQYPRATEHIPEMIEMIECLVSRGHAYALDGLGVYFRVPSFAGYGTLSGNTLEDLDAGARIEVDSRKESPHDFALWKIDPKHLMQWDSPWGRGFPGWHIECSAMSRKYLGDTFDIHTGGEDNIFPHHECERAQSLCSTAGEFARYWVHARHLLVDGTKMAKSAGNFFTINDLLEKDFTGLEIRYSLMTSHYRQQANFTLDGLEASRKAVERLRNFRQGMEEVSESGASGPVRETVQAVVDESRSSAEAALSDDLNISGALGTLFETVRTLNRETPRASEAIQVLAWMRALDEVLGVIFPEQARPVDLAPEEKQWIAERERVRAAGDFTRADQLRDQLLARGIEVKDTPQGTEWKRR
ncbi:MAG: cysteine--tRNA ligase [Planctomycetota bacterium]